MFKDNLDQTSKLVINKSAQTNTTTSNQNKQPQQTSTNNSFQKKQPQQSDLPTNNIISKKQQAKTGSSSSNNLNKNPALSTNNIFKEKPTQQKSLSSNNLSKNTALSTNSKEQLTKTTSASFSSTNRNTTQPDVTVTSSSLQTNNYDKSLQSIGEYMLFDVITYATFSRFMLCFVSSYVTILSKTSDNNNNFKCHRFTII